MWTDPARELAAKIAPLAGQGAAIVFTLKNASSLGAGDVTRVRQTLRTELTRQGNRLVNSEQALAEVRITLSENVQGLVWIAEVIPHKEGSVPQVAMVAVPRRASEQPSGEKMNMLIRKTKIWEQDEPILDYALFDESPAPCAGPWDASPASIRPGTPPGRPAELGPPRVEAAPPCPPPALLVLSPSKLSLLRMHNSSWLVDELFPLPQSKALPRDPRGRLVVRRDDSLVAFVQPENRTMLAAPRLVYSFQAYLPGMKCEGKTQLVLTLGCQQIDEGWPLGIAAGIAGDLLRSPLVTGRNYFKEPSSSEGHAAKASPFFSATSVSDQGNTLWLFAGLDGRTRVFDPGPEPVGTLEGWGSDIVTLKTNCGSGWQVLATGNHDFTQPDTVRAFEVVRREAAAVGPPVEFDGPITALWPAAGGSSAMAVSRNLETGKYEAFTLSISCGR